MKHTELIERLRAGSGGMKHWQELESEAADAIESLQTEVERLNHKDKLITKWTENGELIERLYSAGLQQEHELDALKAERDALKLDAERYRYLFNGNKVYSQFARCYDGWDGSDGKEGFDAAIDADMKGAA